MLIDKTAINKLAGMIASSLCVLGISLNFCITTQTDHGCIILEKLGGYLRVRDPKVITCGKTCRLKV